MGVTNGRSMHIYLFMGFSRRIGSNHNYYLMTDPSDRHFLMHNVILKQKNPDFDLISNERKDKFFHAHGQTVSCFSHLTKDDIL